MAHNKDNVLIALKKAKSLLEKIILMVENDKYCINVIQQNLAVVGLMKSANLSLLEGHLNNCVANAFENCDRDEVDEKMSELLKVLKIAQSK